jgi:HSP20 family molecular chaperone IbpA
MKRMYVLLGCFVLVGLWAVSCLGQMTFDVQTTQGPSNGAPQGFDRQKRRMELREKMHRRMMDKLVNGNGPDQDLFGDMEKEMAEAMKEATAGDYFPSTINPNFGMEWKESASGRSLFITPQSKDQKLEIDTKPNIVTIKGESEQKSAQGVSRSSFQNSFSVPEDVDGTKVKMSQKEGKIVMEFPYKVFKTITTPKKEETRKPLPPSENDVPI